MAAAPAATTPAPTARSLLVLSTVSMTSTTSLTFLAASAAGGRPTVVKATVERTPAVFASVYCFGEIGHVIIMWY